QPRPPDLYRAEAQRHRAAVRPAMSTSAGARRISAERLKESAALCGTHMIIYSTNADRDRAFFRDVLDFPSVDAGGGWLIFALPPAEVAVHPAQENGKHEIYLMRDDVERSVPA